MRSKSFVFLHGFGEDERIWNDFLPTFDWPYSHQTPSYASWSDCKSMDEYAHKIMGELLPNESLILVGHSMGGYIAIAMARLFPTQIDRVILLHSTASADTNEKKINRDRTIHVLRNYGTKNFIGPFIPSLFSTNFVKLNPTFMIDLKNRDQDLIPSALISATISMRDRTDSWKFLDETNIPFLFILGDQDALISCDWVVEKIAEKAQHKFVILQKVGHQGTYENPKSCFQAICDFV